MDVVIERSPESKSGATLRMWEQSRYYRPEVLCSCGLNRFVGFTRSIARRKIEIDVQRIPFGSCKVGLRTRKGRVFREVDKTPKFCCFECDGAPEARHMRDSASNGTIPTMALGVFDSFQEDVTEDLEREAVNASVRRCVLD